MTGKKDTRKKNKKRFYQRLGIGVLIFLIAAVGINRFLEKKQGGERAVLDNPSYPVLEISSEDGDYNLMAAYKSKIDLSLVRNQVTAVDSDKNLDLKLYCYDYDITAIQYVLFTESAEEPLEEGTVNRLEDGEDGIRTGSLTLDTVLNSDVTYYLQLAVRLDQDTRLYFYTRVQNASGYHFGEYLSFSKNFHDKLFDAANTEEAATYLEPSAAATDQSLDTVGIQSTINSVFYGELSLTEVSEPRIKVKELNKIYAVLELRSVVSAQYSEDIVQYYNITETFKLRYTTSRIFLLDYQRSMGAIFNGQIIDSSNNYLGLGIQDAEDVTYLASEDGQSVCFVTEGQLWYYNYKESAAYKVYSLTTDSFSDVHQNAAGNAIKILKMKENGDIIYCVYGYMDRGRDEGRNGIALLTYHASENYTEETMFLETSVPFDIMKNDLTKCAYINSNNIFYCLLDGDLHKITLDSQTDKLEATGLINEALTVSDDGSVIALEEDRDLTKNRQIDLINLETGETNIIRCEDTQRVRAVGFINNDFAYLLAEESQVYIKDSGALLFMADSLHITDSEGKVLKNYTNEGKYISKASVQGSVMKITLAKKKNGQYVTQNKKDYVRYKETEEDQAVSLVSVYSDTYWNQLYLKFPDKVYIKVSPKIHVSTVQTGTQGESIILSESETETERYFVYAGGELQDEYASLSEAIRAADKARGNVIDSNEDVIWQCAFSSYGKVAGMTDAQKADSNQESLAACLCMISRAAGKNIQSSQIDTTQKTLPELLEECTGGTALNLTGTGIRYAFYYIDQDIPVLARTTGNRYIVVMSYNETRVRYLDPVTGESTVVSIDTLSKALKAQGNVIYTYRPDLS